MKYISKILFKMYKLLFVIFLLTFLCCKDNNNVKQALLLSDSNIVEIEKVLSHFPLRSQKYRSAVFIIENMPYHNSLIGGAVESFRDSIHSWDGSKSLSAIWSNIPSRNNNLDMIYSSDIKKITSDFIINDIEFAFDTWNKSLWKDSISFDIFKEYILPYSVCSYQPLVAWRKPLHDAYYSIIEGVDSPKDAFDKVYNHIIKRFKLIDASEVSYIVDPLIANEIMMGTCDMRTMLIVSIARSLCIPSAYDYVNYWANYSSIGHSWPVFVYNSEQAYFFSEQDNKSTSCGPIDASYFPSYLSYEEDSLPFTVDSIKKVAKVMRNTYKANVEYKFIDNNCPILLKRRDYKDVSSCYGLSNSIDIEVDELNNNCIYLCTFVTGRNWTPLCISKQKGKNIVFNNIGKDIVYLPAQIENEDIIPISNPIIVDSNNYNRVLNPDITKLDTISLYRKYPVFTRWLPNRWSKNIGVSFQASNDPAFITNDTLHIINKMPIGVTDIEIDNDRVYRYLRVVPPQRVRLKLAEVSFYEINDSDEKDEIVGELIHQHIPVENAQRLFDKDYLTEVDSKANYYWVGYDLGKDNNKVVSRISYCPWNDGNFIEVGDTYELFYYDMKWISLGEKIADKNFISYNNVPSNSLLYLRNLTKGKEERVFTYEGGKQVWW